jgi:hypothetical protein
MVHIAVSTAAFGIIAKLPLGLVAYEAGSHLEGRRAA